jgi:UDP-N-acetyl-D-glucosamine dehydrogenase
MGIDIWEVIEAASTNPFGFHPFIPARALEATAYRAIGFIFPGKRGNGNFRTRCIELAGEIRINMPYHVVNSVASALNRHKKSLDGARVLVLGTAYKKDIDDLREAPSLTILELLQKEGARRSFSTIRTFRLSAKDGSTTCK